MTTDKLQLLKEANRRGLLSGEQKALYDEAVKRGLIEGNDPAEAQPQEQEQVSKPPMRTPFGIGGMSLGAEMKDKFVGTPEYPDAPSIEDRGMGEKLKLNPDSDGILKQIFSPVNRALWSGNPETMTAAMANELGLQTKQDASGYQYIEHPEHGKIYTEKPGFDAEDLVSGSSKAGAYVAAGIAGQAAKLPALARAGITGVNEFLTDSAIQATGGDRYDPIRAGVAGGIGGLAELGGPLVQALMNKYRTSKSVPEVQRLAAQQGYQLSDDQIRIIARESALTGDTAEQALKANEFGIGRTKGMRTGDFEQLSLEETLRSLPKAGEPLRQLDKANREAIEAQVKTLTGETNQNAQAAAAQASLKEQAGNLKGRVTEAYEGLGKAQFGKESVSGLPLRLRRSISDFGPIDDTLVATKRGLQIVDDAIAELQNAKSFSLKAFDKTRQRISKQYGAAANDTDRAAFTVMRKEFDNWADEALDNALMSGDPNVYAQLKEAQGLRAEYGKKFQARGKSDDAGKIIEKLVKGDHTPEDVANFLIGAQTFGKANAARIAQRYKAAGGDIEPLRRIVIMKMVERRSGDIVGNQALYSNLKTGLYQDGESLMKELFTPAERDHLARFISAIDDILPKGKFAQSSGTTERLVRSIFPLAQKLPFIGKWTDFNKMLQARAAIIPGERAVTPALIPGTATAIEAQR